MSKLGREIVRHGEALQQQIEERHRALGRFSLFYDLYLPDAMTSWSLPASNAARQAEGHNLTNRGKPLIIADRTSLREPGIVQVYAGWFWPVMHHEVTHRDGRDKPHQRLGRRQAEEYIDEFMSLTAENFVDTSQRSRELQKRDYGRLSQGLLQLQRHHGLTANTRWLANYEFNLDRDRTVQICSDPDDELIQMIIHYDPNQAPVSELMLTGRRKDDELRVRVVAFRGDLVMDLNADSHNTELMLGVYEALCKQPERSILGRANADLKPPIVPIAFEEHIFPQIQ